MQRKGAMFYLYLAIGGVLGTLARYGLSGWIHAWAGTSFPWGTFGVNLLGSFLLGFLAQATQLMPVSRELRGFLTVGFCGAFTTFSTFGYETVLLLQQGAWARGALYALGSLGCGLLALFAGFLLAAGTLRAA